jgi:prevent-host-death family protein
MPVRSVNIAELKNKLSAYITYAKAGETIVIRDRNTPVAQLIPLNPETVDGETSRLVADGVLRMPEKPWDIAAFDHLPMPKLKGNALTQAVLEEREEGR